MGDKINRFLLRTMGWLPARMALAAMAWLGFINLYMVRINLSVIIVAMVKRNASVTNTAQCLAMLNTTDDYTSGLLSEDEHNETTMNDAVIEQDKDGDLEWDETVQGFVLAGFYYGYALTQIIGGRLADLYGTRWVYGSCILAGGVSAILSPIAAKTHYSAFIALRIIQGIFQGASWPCMHPCVSRWVPPVERSRFVAVVYLGATLSTSITLPLCGVIISALGWEAAFYVTGVLSLLWCLLWFSFMYDTPREHPRISAKELEYIESAVRKAGTSEQRSRKVPVRSMLKSLPLWAIVACGIGNGWGFTLFLTQLPTYMKNILGFSIKKNGLLSALPFLLRYTGAVTWSTIGDWLIKTNRISVGHTRKGFSVLALMMPAAMITGVVFAGCDWRIIVTLFCVAMFFNGAITTSIVVNHTDIAPNYSGTIFGICNTVSSIVAFIVPGVVGAMITNQQSLQQWQNVFWICVPLYIGADIFYLAFGSGTVQPWNYYGEEATEAEKANGTELEKLNTKQNSD